MAKVGTILFGEDATKGMTLFGVFYDNRLHSIWQNKDNAIIIRNHLLKEHNLKVSAEIVIIREILMNCLPTQTPIHRLNGFCHWKRVWLDDEIPF
jgi:hypothetical protein